MTDRRGPPPFDAVVFDLDGVLTDTAALHFEAWKETFDAFLRLRAAGAGAAIRPFTEGDYRAFVDGKPRYEGVASFLASRAIELPPGEPGDAPSHRTVCGLGNRKNARFLEIVGGGGVALLPGASRLAEGLAAAGYRVGAASSSRNARRILAAAGLLDRLEVVVDGEDAVARGLAGKPRPDIFLAACRDLGAAPDRTAVVEDALAGVAAGAAGGFGLVVGIGDPEDPEPLLAAGADLVVADLSQLDVARFETWFARDLERAGWRIVRHGPRGADERRWETLLAVGNGYLGTRGALEDGPAEVSYRGTYLAGVYNRLESRVGERTLVHDEMVNAPDWLATRLRIGDGPDGAAGLETVRCRRTLELDRGLLEREEVVRDPRGRTTRVRSQRLASMADPHLVALRYRVEPLDWDGRVTLRTGLDGDVVNAGVPRYRGLASRHLEVVGTGAAGDVLRLEARTVTSEIAIALAARVAFRAAGPATAALPRLVADPRAAWSECAAELAPGEALEVEKIVAIYTSRDGDDPAGRAATAAARAAGFDALAEASRRAWRDLWEELDVRIEGDRRAQQMLRLALHHLLVTTGPPGLDLDAGIPARGLHGEAYRGHVFWDEAFVTPLFLLHFPEIAERALRYRRRRLEAAREAAAEEGCRGALFPWQSASDGREETPAWHLNPLSGEWGPDRSRRQRHVSLAIAWEAWLAWHATRDLEALAATGAPLLVEIARFWADRCAPDPETGRFSISGVMGPDEFHEAAPGADDGGLRDNAYTNAMVAWLLPTAAAVLDALPPAAAESLARELDLAHGERQRWREIGAGIRVPAADGGVLEQFDGFFGLAELDWRGLAERHGDLARLDRLLRAEGDTPDRYQVLKQADALMPWHWLPAGEVDRLLDRLGVPGPTPRLAANFDYYFPRTSHGSTLSYLVHGQLAHRLGRHDLAASLLERTLRADYDDVQGGTTGEGIHAGAMAGGVLWVLGLYAGIEIRGERLRVDPDLPAGWRRLACRFRFRGASFRLEVTPETARLEMTGGQEPQEVDFTSERVTLAPGETAEAHLHK